jgi:hypothetical protein
MDRRRLLWIDSIAARALSSPTTCRFIPAHSGLPVIHSLKLAYNSGDQRNRGGPAGRARPQDKLLSRDTLNSLLNRD